VVGGGWGSHCEKGAAQEIGQLAGAMREAEVKSHEAQIRRKENSSITPPLKKAQVDAGTQLEGRLDCSKNGDDKENRVLSVGQDKRGKNRYLTPRKKKKICPENKERKRSETS